MTHTRTAVFVVSLMTLGAGAHPDHASKEVTANAGQPTGRRPMEPVDLPAPDVSITLDGEHRVITTNSVPGHAIGEFPNSGNPNAVRSIDREIRIPRHPRRAARRSRAAPEFGVALSGIIFDAGTGEFWTPTGQRGFSAWNYDAGSANNQGRFGVDFNHGHVQPTGKYHYHGVPTALLESLTDAQSDGADRMIHLGWAFDGFPIYAPFGHEDPGDAASPIVELKSSYRLKQGTRPEPPEGPGGDYDGTFAEDYEYVEGLGHLDESNGRTGVTPQFPGGTYYYVITDAFPFVPRTWVGTPDPSVTRRRPGAGPPEGRQRSPREDAFPPRPSRQVPAGLNEAGTPPVRPAYFIEDALAAPIIAEERTLLDGSSALCYVIRTYSEPHEHDMGPWSPAHIEDSADMGGIWFHEGEVHDVDGPFVRDIAELYDDPRWKLYREDGSIRVTDAKEAFEAAARPNVDPEYQNHVVEGRPEWVDRAVTVFVIPVQPVYQDEPTTIGPPQGGPDRAADADGRPLRPAEPGEGGPQGGPGLNALGIAFNGVEFAPPAPIDAILAAHTIAPLDDAGGHLNPHDGYHYHAVTGHTKEIAQPDGHAAMIGYAMDGFAIYAHADADGSVSHDLDECGGHWDTIRGYHYHAGAPGENQIIKAFRGIPGTMTVTE